MTDPTKEQLMEALSNLLDWMDNLPTDEQLGKRDGRRRVAAARSIITAASKVQYCRGIVIK
jgi:hypothetical protein